MSKAETIIQLLKIFLGGVFGYFMLKALWEIKSLLLAMQ